MNVLINKKLLERADFQREIAEHNFVILKCKKCLGTKLMKKRDCDLLYGYRKPCCDLMDKFIEKATKKVNNMILLNGLNIIKNATHNKKR